MSFLEARRLLKKFPGVVALRNLDVTIEGREVHCIIGENGAGKSTLVKILTGVYTPDEGEVIIDGVQALEHPKVFEKVSYVPQELNLFQELTVSENLEVARRLHPGTASKAVGALIERMGLLAYADRRAGTLSQGNARRLLGL